MDVIVYTCKEVTQQVSLLDRLSNINEYNTGADYTTIFTMKQCIFWESLFHQ